MTTAWEKLQEFVTAEMRKVYSETTLDHAMNPRNVGNIENADGFAAVTGPCGDTMEIWLRVENDRIIEAAFMTDGCGTTIATGSMVTELVKGEAISHVLRISQRDVLKALGGLPEESQHCALLAINTMKAAIGDYLTMKREPWKRAYRKY
jgi:nitrogen fixation NifU-like protein